MSSSIIKSDNGVTSGVTGIISSGGSDGTLLLQTTTSGGTATTAVTIDNSQKVTFANSIGFGSNQGIIFNPSTQGSGHTSNTLTDYEEGTWTPSWSSTGATFSYGGQIARYTKIGNMVAIYGYIVNASASGTTSNGVSLSGLPFTSSNVSGFYQPINLGQLFNITWGGGFPILYIPPNSTFASFFNERNGTTEVAVTASNISGGAVMFSGVYQATF